MLLTWFDTHFPPSTFHGRFQLGFRKKNSTSLLPLVTFEREQLREFLENMYIRKDYDYYIMANSICGTKRNLNGLFSFYNMVIDLDLHLDGEIEEILEEFIWRFRRDKPEDMPEPHSIVKTGRGLQLWWSIPPVHMKCKTYFDEVRNHFMYEIEKILKEYSVFADFSIDRGASCNDVGYFRLPTSYNTKVKKKAVIQMGEGSVFFTLQELIKRVKKLKLIDAQDMNANRTVQRVFSEEKLTENFLEHDIFILKNITTLSFFRIRQLILLRKLRNCKVSLETRNNFNFLMYNTLRSTMGHEEAWVKLIYFNEGFLQPMTTKELEGVIISAKTIGGYKYTNKKIIEFLDISFQEQELIGLFPGKQESICRYANNPSRNVSRAFEKECRNDNVYKLRTDGKKIFEIAQETGLSTPTISKILNLKSNKKDQKEYAMSLLESGNKLSQVSLLTGLSISTIKRLKGTFLKKIK